MADNLGVIRSATQLQIREIDSGANQLGVGRGHHLRTLVLHAVEQFDLAFGELDSEVALIEASAPDEITRIALRANAAQKYERLGVQVQLAYALLNTFSGSVGRTDVPIGLQHLLGTVLGELVAEPADPIVHLNPIKMYSTKDLVDRLDELLQPHRATPLSDSYTDPHPIVFNLPALDPSNALLSPIIAHEVGHTAVERELREALKLRVDADVQGILQAHLSAVGLPNTGQHADAWSAVFRDWCGELICDAVALVSAGPAFALAFASFAQPSAAAMISSHPPVTDRYALHLKILDELGWTGVMNTELPGATAWLAENAAAPLLLNTSLESFLRAAMARVGDDITAIAREHVSSPLDPVATAAILPQLVQSIRDGIPNVEIGDDAATPWQIVLAGWIAAIDPTKDAGTQLIEVVGDRGLSDLLIKSIELSSIVRSWRALERADS